MAMTSITMDRLHWMLANVPALGSPSRWCHPSQHRPWTILGHPPAPRQESLANAALLRPVAVVGAHRKIRVHPGPATRAADPAPMAASRTTEWPDTVTVRAVMGLSRALEKQEASNSPAPISAWTTSFRMVVGRGPNSKVRLVYSPAMVLILPFCKHP